MVHAEDYHRRYVTVEELRRAGATLITEAGPLTGHWKFSDGRTGHFVETPAEQRKARNGSPDGSVLLTFVLDGYREEER